MQAAASLAGPWLSRLSSVVGTFLGQLEHQAVERALPGLAVAVDLALRFQRPVPQPQPRIR